VQADHLDEVGAPERRIVGVVVADVRSAPTDAAPIIDRLPVAAPLAIQERQGEWLRISYDGWVAFRDTVDIAQLASRFPRDVRSPSHRGVLPRRAVSLGWHDGGWDRLFRIHTARLSFEWGGSRS
jgi:hypothetical protein